MAKQDTSSNLDKVLTILEEISDHPAGISLAELSKRTLIAKTTIFRILESLKAREYVTMTPETERYTLDIKSLELGIKGLMNANLVEIAIPYLKKFSSTTSETSFLGVYNQGEVVYLYKSEGALSIQTDAQLGSRKPAYCTGVGKALLAFQPEEEIERVLSMPLAKVTRGTITDKDKLREVLRQIREQGYALDDEENEEGLTCVAMPVFNYTGAVVGSISLSGPTPRIKSKMGWAGDLLREYCHAISRRLGYIGAPVDSNK
jgi:Transcriptional regulator